MIIHKTAQGMSLYGRSRDVDEIDKAIEFDRETCRWSIIGSAPRCSGAKNSTPFSTSFRKKGRCG